MEQNPGAAGPSRKPPSPSPYLTTATQHHHHPPPPQTSSIYSQIPPENQTAAAPQGFLPFYHPNQFFRGFLHANAAAGFGQPPPRSEAAVSAAAAGRSGLQQNQGETGSLFVKSFTENKEATVLESRKAVLMGELEAMCGNAPPSAAVAPPPSAAVDSNAGSDSNIDDDDMAKITGYMEEAVKKLMAHQQSLHESFIEKLEKMEAKRRAMEEELRHMEMERMELMASFIEKDKVIAMKCEEIIFDYLKKVTGQTIQKSIFVRSDQRWPDHEVNKLVEIRGGLEPRFNQLGCKIGVWEEISRLMAVAGYQRTAMRCKEKWEDINKYFKKLKKNSSPRKRAKTCQYYEKLDQLYSVSSSGCSTSDANGNVGMGDDQTIAMKKEEEEGRKR